ncbi:MAG TPA: hypothetical protein VMZ90_03285, partial [Vicinamibacterales bacterium]|nr:hypothetical protein [Vicinamibacterales bacterium]
MTTAARPADPPIDPSWIAPLGGIEFPSDSWVRYLARILVQLLSRAPLDTLPFRWAAAHWARHQDTLRVAAVGAREIVAPGLTEKYQVLTALAAHAHRGQKGSAPPLATLFALLIFELHLRGRYTDSQDGLSEILRGLSRHGERSPLLDSLGSVSAPEELRDEMRRLGAGKGEQDSLTGLNSFDKLWRTELCAALDWVISAGESGLGAGPEEEPLATQVVPSSDPDEEDALEEAPFVVVPAI